MQEPNITTSKMPKETEQQYTAWLLYCETGSLDKLLQAWTKVGQKADEIGIDFGSRLGEKPARSTLGEWQKRYHWIERRELKLIEDLETLRGRLKKIKREKLYKIADAFERMTNKILKQLRSDKEPTILEWKMVWEMFQVELGKPTSRAQLKTEEQKPLTPEEKEYGKELHKAVAWYIRQEHEKKTNIEKTNKTT